jgi:hypothetical protein
LVLAAAEWARRNQPSAFPQFHRDLFHAHFVLDEDIEDATVIDRHANDSDIALVALHAVFENDSAAAAVTEAEMIGDKSYEALVALAAFDEIPTDARRQIRQLDALVYSGRLP